MKLIQGFVIKNSFIDNSQNATSEFFELSPFSLTYSRTQGDYQHLDYPGDLVHTFKCVDVESGELYIITPEQVKEILATVNAVFSYANSNSAPYVRMDYINSVQANMNASIGNLTMGQFYPGSHHTLPEWISWESVTFPGTKVKIWLRNAAFEAQYSDYEILVSPPIDQLDAFFGSYAAQAEVIKSTRLNMTMDSVMALRQELPETYLRIFEFDYVNPNNTTQRTSVRWAVLIYGENGDNVDSIKDAIVDYALKHSTKTMAEWETVFPELFTRTEFLFMPRWDRIAIPNLTDLGALYSNLNNPNEVIVKAIAFWNEINSSWIENNLTVIPFDYKSLSVVALNGNTNRVGFTKLSELFPDYLPMGTMMPDFNRMSVNTRNWVLKMVELLKTAETVTAESTIANPMRRVFRNNKLYVCVMYNDINFLVAARVNFGA